MQRGLRAMQARGELDAAADPTRMATAVLASIQGGLLLAQTYQSAQPLRIALDAALVYLHTFADPGQTA